MISSVVRFLIEVFIPIYISKLSSRYDWDYPINNKNTPHFTFLVDRSTISVVNELASNYTFCNR